MQKGPLRACALGPPECAVPHASRDIQPTPQRSPQTSTGRYHQHRHHHPHVTTELQRGLVTCLRSHSLDLELDQTQVFRIPNLGSFYHTTVFYSHGILHKGAIKWVIQQTPQEEFYIHTPMATCSAAPWSKTDFNTMVVRLIWQRASLRKGGSLPEPSHAALPSAPPCPAHPSQGL